MKVSLGILIYFLSHFITLAGSFLPYATPPLVKSTTSYDNREQRKGHSYRDDDLESRPASNSTTMMPPHYVSACGKHWYSVVLAAGTCCYILVALDLNARLLACVP